MFRELLRELEQSERWSIEALQRQQIEALDEFREHACRYVPHYRELDRANALPAIESLEDLRSWPLLSKEDLRGKEARFRSRRPLMQRATATSGTSGSPTKLYRDRYSINLEHAALWRQRRWAGVAFSDRRATLRGDVIAEAEQRVPPFWAVMEGGRQLLMSSFHLSESFIPYYLEALRRFKPAYIEAYPSSAYRIARYMGENGEDPIAVKGVFTSSETLFEWQRRAIERAFGPVFDYYGNGERVAFLPMCERGRYHYALDYSVVEFLPSGQEGLYEVVGTNIHNRAMPLFRYRTGDLVELSSERCACGRSFPLISRVLGRQDDFVVTPSGEWVGRLDRAFADVPHLIEAQVLQEQLEAVVVRVVATQDFCDADERGLLARLRERLGAEMRIELERVPRIERTGAGKLTLVVSKLGKAAASGEASAVARD